MQYCIELPAFSFKKTDAMYPSGNNVDGKKGSTRVNGLGRLKPQNLTSDLPMLKDRNNENGQSYDSYRLKFCMSVPSFIPSLLFRAEPIFSVGKTTFV